NNQPLDAGEVFRLCISRVRSADLRARLYAIEDNVRLSAVEYRDAAANARLQQIQRTADVAGIVTSNEMVKIYTGRMVPSTQPGRPVYNRILAAPADSRCPLCDVG